jgi:FkbM family methyltransferase
LNQCFRTIEDLRGYFFFSEYYYPSNNILFVSVLYFRKYIMLILRKPQQQGGSHENKGQGVKILINSAHLRKSRMNITALFVFAVLLVTTLPPFQQILVSPDFPAASPAAPQKSIQTWTSPHLIDCKQTAADLAKESEQGLFKEIRLTNPSFLMNIHDPSKDAVSREIYNSGCWECGHIKGMLKALSTYHDSYFLDIGGNIGMWSLTAAAANHQTFTIEALSDNVQRICKSIGRNSLHNRTHLMHIIASSEPQMFRLDVPQGNIGGTSVVAVGNDMSNKDVNNHFLKGVTIDSLNLPIDSPVVMKIDVEGHELEVLLGAIGFLRGANIVYANMELRSNLYMDQRWKEVFGILVSKGLMPYRINYEDETALDVDDLRQWKHFKHPLVKYFDVVWRLKSFVV